MKTGFYNSYHRQNKNVASQRKVISEKDYTYQYTLAIINDFFRKPGNVLDVGCGVGTIDLYLALKGHSVTAIDISKDAIELANKSKSNLSLDNIEFIVADISDYIYPKNKFHYAICSEVIEHVDHDGELLKSIHSSLRTGGLLVISTPSVNAPLFKWGKLNDFDRRVGHLRRYSEVNFRNIIIKAGFEIIEFQKNEGVLRNLLYTSNFFGNFVRFIRWPVTIPVNFIDTSLVKLFGESDLLAVCKK